MLTASCLDMFPWGDEDNRGINHHSENIVGRNVLLQSRIRETSGTS